eukprot:scaffold321492_cov152-Cyclotella_meneghiniana.AAC.1
MLNGTVHQLLSTAVQRLNIPSLESGIILPNATSHGQTLPSTALNTMAKRLEPSTTILPFLTLRVALMLKAAASGDV